MTFKSKVTALKFSPCGRFIAVAMEYKNMIQIWRTPLHGLSSAMPLNEDEERDLAKDFAPFVLHRTFTGHHDKVTKLLWSPDSNWIMSSGKDMMIRLYTREPLDGYKPLTLAGHRDYVIGAWWSKDMRSIYSVSKDGSCFVWHMIDSVSGEPVDAFTPGQTKFKLAEKHFFNQKGDHGPARVKCAELHSTSGLLVVGFSTGVFGLYEMPDFNHIHSLSISQRKITSLTISPSGEWLAFASSDLGQLLVWEWQSETYVLKQQGHFYDLNCLAYSPDGQTIATGGDDGKVKVWSTSTGFCFVTFNEHQAGITGVKFAGKQGGKQGVVYTSSLDGTVRAFDLIRYRNFRTFTSPTPVQFNCLAVDPTGEIVCAGSLDTFEIYVWSVQTGRLLDILAGHEGPISSLAFSPEGTLGNTSSTSSTSAVLLVSGSWDQTVRVWDLFSRGSTSKCMETFRHKSDVLTVSFRPDGKEICAATLDGHITFWDPYEGGHPRRITEIEGRRDIAGGRKSTDLRTAANNAADKYFTSLCYTADGDCLLAGGNSKWVCLYDIPNGVLLKKFQLSKNLSLDGLLEKLNSKNLTDAGPMDLLNDEEFSDLEDKLAQQNTLPGVQKGDLSERKVKPAIRSKCVQFSPTGRSWAAATTEGLVIYSLDDSLVFDPFDLDIDITPSNVLERVKTLRRTGAKEGEWLLTLVMALRLNENGVLQLVYESVPPQEIEFVVRDLPRIYLDKLLRVIAVLLDVSGTDEDKQALAASFRKSPHVEYHLTWLNHILRIHGRYIRDQFSNQMFGNSAKQTAFMSASSFSVILRAVKKNVTVLRDDLSKMCDNNLYTIKYFLKQAESTKDNGEDTSDLMAVDDLLTAA